MATVTCEQEPREGISWRTYESLLAEVENRAIRMTYDQGTLEIVSASRRHERLKSLIGRMIEILTLELGIPISSGGSTTHRSDRGGRHIQPSAS
jgi:hypothetical protein